MMHCIRLVLMLVFSFILTTPAYSQVADTSTPAVAADSLALKADTTAALPVSDSVAKVAMEDSLGIKISKDALPSPVTAEATDSAVMDMKRNIFYLYGNAIVTHEDLKLNAGQIAYEQATGTVIAQPTFDSVGGIVQRPSFAQGSETVTYDSLQYNFQSKRAIIRNARSQYGEGFVHSQQVKRNPDQSIYGWKNIYTTCSLDTPHFGIRAQKIKVIPNRVIASASANIMIEQVPTPFFLPFGLFPITQRQRSGFQLPSYTLEEQRGLGLTNGGYYFHFSDQLDFLLLANIFTKGSYNLSGISTYANRYKYAGNVSINYAYNKTGESYEPGASINRSYALQWSHRTDAKARPGVNFNASVNIASQDFYQLNSYNYNQIVQNQLYSSVTYSKTWQNKPYSLNIGATHSQNLGTGEIRMTIPQASFFISQFTPFQDKNRIGTPRWYERITSSYQVDLLNQTVVYDSAFSLSTLSFNDFSNGIKHQVPISASYNVLRFINLSFNFNYSEYWLTERSLKYYNATEDQLKTVSSRGFFTARDVSANMGLSTRIYGVKMFKRGGLMGIRHVLTPNATIGYVPDYAAAPFRYFYQTRVDTSKTLVYQSPYDNSIIGTPGMGQFGKFASTLGFGLNNNLQIKVRSKNDTTGTGKNVTLIDGLGINSSYNFAADSFNLGLIRTDFRTNILNKLSISANALFDAYDRDAETGRRIKTTTLNNGRGLARFTNGSVSLSSTFRSKENGSKKQLTGDYADEYNLLMQNGSIYNYVDFDIPWTLNVSYTLNLDNAFSTITKRDTLVSTQSLTFYGDFNLTPRWKIAVNSGYDFRNKQLTITTLDIYRDMHCWEMRLSSIPFGPRKSYTFTLNVKASVLQDLKLVRRRSSFDAAQF